MNELIKNNLMKELNEKYELYPFWIVIFFINGVHILFYGGYELWPVVQVVLTAFLIVIFLFDKRRKVTILSFYLDTDFIAVHSNFVSSISCLMLSDKQLFRKNDLGKVSDFQRVRGIKVNNYLFESEIIIPSINCQSITFHFLPNCIVIFEQNEYRYVNYQDVKISTSKVDMLSYSCHPKDSEVVGYGWQHQRIDGTRDRRFKVNREVPRYRYEKITLKHNTFEIDFVFSKEGSGLNFLEAINSLVKALMVKHKVEFKIIDH